MFLEYQITLLFYSKYSGFNMYFRKKIIPIKINVEDVPKSLNVGPPNKVSANDRERDSA